MNVLDWLLDLLEIKKYSKSRKRKFYFKKIKGRWMYGVRGWSLTAHKGKEKRRYGMNYFPVDDDDFEKVSRHKWCANWNKNVNSFYAIRRIT
ncbi:hypothetical protein HY485_01015, partial [Candidatus Woesearchaeota archaeon]|nr:hypothetical protein [Candidatus Woesearchaeota archaeon]